MKKIFTIILLFGFIGAIGQTYKPEKNKIEWRNNTRFKVSPFAVPAVADSGLVTKIQIDSIKTDTVSIRQYISGSAGSLAKFQAGDTTLRAGLVGVDYLSGNKSMLRTIRRLGGAIVTWGFSSDAAWVSTHTPTDASLYGYLLEPIEKDSTITGVYYTLQQSGVFTGVDTCSIAIYELDNVTLTKVAEGTPAAAMFKVTANTKASKAFASTYTMKANKLYYVCWLYNNSAQTTAPIFYSKNASGGAINKFLTNGTTKLGFVITSQASLPATITLTDGQTAITSVPAIWIY